MEKLQPQSLFKGLQVLQGLLKLFQKPKNGFTKFGVFRASRAPRASRSSRISQAYTTCRGFEAFEAS